MQCLAELLVKCWDILGKTITEPKDLKELFEKFQINKLNS